MKITILTVFPEFFDQFIKSSIIGRAISKGIVSIKTVNIRDYSDDRNHRVDDHPLGGGAGLIMKLDPIVKAINDNSDEHTHKILLGPKGKTYTQDKAVSLSKEEDVLLLCGHYEGIDSRIINYVDEEISVGDYILTGGEIAAMAISDSIVRLLKGAIADESTEDESFNGSILEYPQYTYPKDYDGHEVPDVLFCGNHEVVDEVRRKEALKETYEKRPDLIETMTYDKEDALFIKQLESGEEIEESEKEKEATEKGRKFIKN